MASSKPKRDLADFFKPYPKARFSPTPNVPRKRPSPPPDDVASKVMPTMRSTCSRNARLDECSSPPVPSSSPWPCTPPSQRPKYTSESPKTPGSSAVNIPHSAQLAIRTPQTTRTIPPPETYINAPTFVKTPVVEDRDESRPRSLSDKRVEFSAADLSTLPVLTQKVVRKDMVVAVRDSDEEDTDSLASLTDIFGKREGDDETSTSSLLDEDETKLERDRANTLQLFLNGRSDPAASKKKLRDILALKTSGKRDAKKFLDHQRTYLANARNIEQLREKYESTLHESDDIEAQVDAASNLENYFGGTEDAEKVISAVQRTEALSEEVSYSFYGRLGMRNLHLSPLPEAQFPDEAIPLQLFRAWDPEERSKQYLSGVISHLARQNKLKNDALEWTFEAFISEPSLLMRSAYISTLEAAAPNWVRTGVTPRGVQLVFYALANDLEEVAQSVRFQLRPLPLSPPQIHPEYLVSTLELFSKISAHMSFESLSALASLLTQVTVDSRLMGNSSIASGVEDLFDHILGSSCEEEEAALHVASHIVSTVSQSLHEPALQVQLLEHIRPTSNVALSVRITLAHLFLFGVPASEPLFLASQPPLVDLPRLIDLLTVSDDFATSRLRGSLNYSELRARTVLLDIAISDGGRPPVFPSEQYTKPRDFNRQIDLLAAAVRRTWTAIADTGATHMKRAEAKDKLDCVYHRLLYVVRTEPPPRKHIFDQMTGKYGDGDEMRATARGRETMKSFLAKAEEARRPKGAVNRLDEVKEEPVSQPAKENNKPDLLAFPPGSIVRTSSASSSVAEFVDAVECQLPSLSGTLMT